jgi:1-acyl-sn-glycerol-3-phosphate acyltransferase
VPHWQPEDVSQVVYAPHWYDGFVLYLKQYFSFLGYDSLAGKLVIGPGRIRTSYAKQLATYKQQASQFLSGAPVLIGEFGIPFDLQRKKAYRSGNFSKQIKAMDRSLRALEDALLSGTLWNYNADNTNVHGDQWNGEDFSIFSRDQQTDPQDIHSGGRALPAVVRPYARAVAGEPLRMTFDPDRKVFTFMFRHDATVTAPTELFLPNYQYPHGYAVEVSDGSVEIDREQQVLRYHHTTTCDIHTIRLTGEGKKGEKKSLWSGFLLPLPANKRTILRDRGKKPRTLRDSWGRRALSQVMWLVMRFGSLVLFRRKLIPHVEGLEHLPRSGPVLIAARHFHWFYDGYVLVRIVPRRLHIMVALDWLQSRALRFLIELACSLPDWPIVLRDEEFREHKEDKPWVYTHVEARRYLRRVILAGNRLLRSGAILVMFPEGYASIDPHPTPKQDIDAFLPFQRGFVRFAELAERDGKTRVAIIPAGFTYTREGDKPWHATVRFGSALFRSDFANSEQLLQAVEERVQALSYAVLPSLAAQAPDDV